MTTAIDLTTSWQEIAPAGKIWVETSCSDYAFAHFSASAPSGDVGFKQYDDDIIQGEFANKLYMKILDADETATITVYSEPA